MNDGIIIGGAGFLVTLIALIKPIINLNTSITELKTSIDQFKDSINKLDARITAHGHELDTIKERIANHEARIHILEDHN